MRRNGRAGAWYGRREGGREGGGVAVARGCWGSVSSIRRTAEVSNYNIKRNVLLCLFLPHSLPLSSSSVIIKLNSGYIAVTISLPKSSDDVAFHQLLFLILADADIRSGYRIHRLCQGLDGQNTNTCA